MKAGVGAEVVEPHVSVRGPQQNTAVAVLLLQPFHRGIGITECHRHKCQGHWKHVFTVVSRAKFLQNGLGFRTLTSMSVSLANMPNKKGARSTSLTVSSAWAMASSCINGAP